MMAMSIRFFPKATSDPEKPKNLIIKLVSVRKRYYKCLVAHLVPVSDY